MINAQQLSAARAAFARVYLVETADILALAETRKPNGGVTRSWTTKNLRVGARANAMASPITRDEAGRRIVVADWVVKLPYGTEVGPEERVRINGVDYSPVGMDTSRTEQLCLVLQCKRLD